MWKKCNLKNNPQYIAKNEKIWTCCQNCHISVVPPGNSLGEKIKLHFENEKEKNKNKIIPMCFFLYIFQYSHFYQAYKPQKFWRVQMVLFFKVIVANIFFRIDTGDDNRVSKEEFCSDKIKESIETWVGKIEDMEAEFDTIDTNAGGQVRLIKVARSS